MKQGWRRVLYVALGASLAAMWLGSYNAARLVTAYPLAPVLFAFASAMCFVGAVKPWSWSGRALAYGFATFAVAWRLVAILIVGARAGGALYGRERLLLLSLGYHALVLIGLWAVFTFALRPGDVGRYEP